MDISQIRSLLGECFSRQDDRRHMSAEDDFAEAEQALRALKAVLESELRTRASGTETPPRPLH